jgi:hypothetical protein
LGRSGREIQNEVFSKQSEYPILPKVPEEKRMGPQEGGAFVCIYGGEESLSLKSAFQRSKAKVFFPKSKVGSPPFSNKLHLESWRFSGIYCKFQLIVTNNRSIHHCFVAF